MVGSRDDDLLSRLARFDRTAVFLVVLALTVLGLFVPGPIGPLLLLAVVAVLVALLGRTWSVTPAPMRAFRLLVLAGLATLAVIRLA